MMNGTATRATYPWAGAWLYSSGVPQPQQPPPPAIVSPDPRSGRYDRR